MSTKKIVITILGAMLTAGLTTSSSFWPEYNAIFSACSTLVVAVVAQVNNKKPEGV